MIRANIKIRVSSSTISKSLVKSVAPDNVKMTGLSVAGRAFPRKACFNISYEGRIETFISTLEDLLRCIQAAEGTLQGIRKDRME